jgi:hypothetical protein
MASTSRAARPVHPSVPSAHTGRVAAAVKARGALRLSSFVIRLIRHSINVRLGKCERVAEQLEARLRAFQDDNFDDVETEKNVWIIKEPEPGQTAARNSSLLVPIDGIERATEIFSRPRLYFDEDECVVIAADDIDLAAGPAAKITIEDFVTVPPQKPARQFLPASPKPKMFGTRRQKAAAPPVRKIGDESDRARAHAI